MAFSTPTVSDPRPPSEQITTKAMLEGFQIDLFTRWVLAILSFLITIPVIGVGMFLWVCSINNFNILGWLE
jgi:hypothetical protein